ncbi:MAG: hypothetical protein KDI37_13870, partial [Xanthomonadales bacterium]|nr:hypothetical protein [Xanthomonadales bacterium]
MRAKGMGSAVVFLCMVNVVIGFRSVLVRLHPTQRQSPKPLPLRSTAAEGEAREGASLLRHRERS